MQNIKVSIVIPAYNEEGNIVELTERILSVITPIGCDYEVIYINDGSSDNTESVLQMLNHKNANVNYVSFSRNFGHQNALKAGLDLAIGNCVISLDADLQHPPELISEMIFKWQEGYDIVYTKRLPNKKIPFKKRLTSAFFYKTINFMSDIEFENGTADFRLMDRSVVQVFSTLNETEPFVRGLVKWVGFKQYCLDYHPSDRFSGETKYSFRKMIRFALNGITSFSIRPLRIASLVGLFISIIGFLYGLGAVYTFFFTDMNISGWTSLIMAVVFIGGIQLLMLGIVGEYMGKLFIQAKGRPNYIIKKTSLKQNER